MRIAKNISAVWDTAKVLEVPADRLTPQEAVARLRAIARALPPEEFGRAAECLTTARALEEALAERRRLERQPEGGSAQ